MTTQTPEELVNAMFAAQNRGDTETAAELWKQIVAAIAARPKAVVDKMEAERGLT